MQTTYSAHLSISSWWRKRLLSNHKYVIVRCWALPVTNMWRLKRLNLKHTKTGKWSNNLNSLNKPGTYKVRQPVFAHDFHRAKGYTEPVWIYRTEEHLHAHIMGWHTLNSVWEHLEYVNTVKASAWDPNSAGAELLWRHLKSQLSVIS